MIKPDTLWNLFKHGDKETIGRVCMALANRQEELETPLNNYESMFFNMIREAEEWMEEAVEAVKQRKHAWYEQKKKKEHLTDLTSNASNASIDHPPSVRPSIRPSIHPSNIEKKHSVSHTAHAREFVVPTIEKVLQECRRSTRYPIDEAFATEWYGLMERNGWKNAKGESVLSNWNVKLSYAWMDEQKRKRDIKDREEAKRKAEEEAALEAQRRDNYLQHRLLSEDGDD